ncbi:MAG: hypothetical protein ACI3XJ_02395 [Oscillospiraceae bacterium]
MRKSSFWPCLRGELWKVFHSRAFYAALIAGLLIQLCNVGRNIWYVQLLYDGGARHVDGDTRSLFILWLSAGMNMAYYLFQWLFPLLALIPYGWSYGSEAQSGYRNQLLVRVSKASYFTTKYIGSFVSGATVIALPLGLNLLLNAMICPAVVPQAYSMVVPIHPLDMMYQLFFSHPWLYAFLWLGISALWGGVIAGLSVLLSQWIKKGIFVIILPCAVVYLLSYILGAWAPANSFLISSHYFRIPAIVFGEMGALAALSLGGGLALFSRREVL